MVFHRVCAWVRQGTRGSELSSKKLKSWIAATFSGILPRNVIFRVPGVAFRKTQGNPMPFEGFLWGEFTKKSCFHKKSWNCNDFIKIWISNGNQIDFFKNVTRRNHSSSCREKPVPPRPVPTCPAQFSGIPHFGAPELQKVIPGSQNAISNVFAHLGGPERK